MSLRTKPTIPGLNCQCSVKEQRPSQPLKLLYIRGLKHPFPSPSTHILAAFIPETLLYTRCLTGSEYPVQTLLREMEWEKECPVILLTVTKLWLPYLGQYYIG